MDKKYGDKETHVSELVNKVWLGATISWNNIQGLKDLVRDLVNCVTNLRYLGYLKEIDTQGSGNGHIELSVIRSGEETCLLSPVEEDRVHSSISFTAEKGATGYELCWMTLGLYSPRPGPKSLIDMEENEEYGGVRWENPEQGESEVNANQLLTKKYQLSL
ncbi:hypothetical protein O3P69_020191 [Scylla paramamosain]|uniref:Uncharacterized protein n=1 Tax=Scylla paramamosain TaxID=85552 RepID=A0AAW0TK78_SCYPA